MRAQLGSVHAVRHGHLWAFRGDKPGSSRAQALQYSDQLIHRGDSPFQIERISSLQWFDRAAHEALRDIGDILQIHVAVQPDAKRLTGHMDLQYVADVAESF